METHDHQPSADAGMSHAPAAAATENMTSQAPGTAPASAEPAAQAMAGQAGAESPDGQAKAQASPAEAAQAASQAAPSQAASPQTTAADPSAQTAMPGQQGPVQQDPAASQFPQGQTADQQAQFQSNVIMDPATGQMYYAMPQGQFVQPPPQNGQYVYYTQAPPEQAPEPHQPDYAQIIKSVEDFAEGDASVADVVKTLWTETAQDDQFWKGAMVGAAAAVLLTSGSVRGAMAGIFGKKAADTAAASGPAPEVDPETK